MNIDISIVKAEKYTKTKAKSIVSFEIYQTCDIITRIRSEL